LLVGDILVVGFEVLEHVIEEAGHLLRSVLDLRGNDICYLGRWAFIGALDLLDADSGVTQPANLISQSERRPMCPNKPESTDRLSGGWSGGGGFSVRCGVVRGRVSGRAR
jgi:hypothetical protein